MIIRRCMSPAPQNGFRKRKVYHNFVLILYNFVHKLPNFVHPPSSAIRNSNLGVGDMQSPKCSFNIKNWIIILCSFCTILYTKSQILYTSQLESCLVETEKVSNFVLQKLHYAINFEVRNSSYVTIATKAWLSTK